MRGRAIVPITRKILPAPQAFKLLEPVEQSQFKLNPEFKSIATIVGNNRCYGFKPIATILGNNRCNGFKLWFKVKLRL